MTMGTVSSLHQTLGLAFLSPAMAIAAGACVGVPILIHLLTRQRRKPIQWAAMKFLLEAYRRHRRRLTLEQMLLLACRCLVVLLVGLALAGPVLNQRLGGRGPVHLYLLIDNSLASRIRETDAKAGGGSTQTALDRFKVEARALLGELDGGRGDRAAVMTLASPSDAAVLPPSQDLAAIGRVVDDISSADSRADLSGAISRLRVEFAGGRDRTPQGQEASREEARVVVAILSDLREGSVDLSQPIGSLGGEGAPLVASMPPADEPLDNTAVVSLEPLRPIVLAAAGNAGGESQSVNQVRVGLRRFGPGTSKAATTTVRAWLGDAKSLASPPAAEKTIVKWQPGEESATAIIDVHAPQASADALALVARIDGDVLPADDTFVRSVQARRAVRVAVVESLKLRGGGGSASIDQFSQGDWIRLLLQPDADSGPLGTRSSSGLEPTTLDPASVGRAGLAGFDAAIVLAPDELTADGWKRLEEFSEGGGLVVVTPPAAEQIHVWGDSYSRSMGLDWTIGREVETLAVPMALGAEAPGGPANPLLGLLAAEVPALAKPVSVLKRLTLGAPEGSAAAVLLMEDGKPLALASIPGQSAGAATAAKPSTPADRPVVESSRGVVVLLACAIDLGWTDLPTKPLMLPLLHEMLRVGVGRSQQTFDRVAGDVLRTPQGAAELVAADTRATDGGASSAGGNGSPARSAGVWRAVTNQGATLSLVAVNPDTSASDTGVVAPARATGLLAGIAGQERLIALGAATEGKTTQATGALADALGSDPSRDEPVSLPLLASALALALVEVFLARQFSHASRGGEAAGVGGSPA